MSSEKLTYLIIENAPDVCEGIARRMAAFPTWHSLGYCTGIKEAIKKVNDTRPHFIYLDWGLNGGSAYEVLQFIQNLSDYRPYILFNTGFQKDNPEIPQEIFNNYQVDKYLLKPFWEDLRKNLGQYLKQAEEKVFQNFNSDKSVWLTDINNIKVTVDLSALMCICQHPFLARSRVLYFSTSDKELNVSLQWQKFYDLLTEHAIAFFVTKSRSHLVVRDFIETYEKPFVRLRNFPPRIEVVKENQKAFESWLEEK